MWTSLAFLLFGVSCVVTINPYTTKGLTQSSQTTYSYWFPDLSYVTGNSFSGDGCKCGIKNPARIVGGEESDMHEYPWQVILRHKGTDMNRCGGILISPNYVLTASHCFECLTVNEMYVSLGEHQTETESETDKTIKLNVTDMIRHERYCYITSDNDIGLLRLEEPVTFNDAISPACLPFGMEDYDISGKTGTVTGWGDTSGGGTESETLLEVDLPLLTTCECQQFLGNEITDNMICTYKPGKDSCQGDSGGPLVMDEGGRNYVMGIVSWGKGCAQTGLPGVYTKVTNYLDWIEENTKGETFCKKP